MQDERSWDILTSRLSSLSSHALPHGLFLRTWSQKVQLFILIPYRETVQSVIMAVLVDYYVTPTMEAYGHADRAISANSRTKRSCWCERNGSHECAAAISSRRRLWGIHVILLIDQAFAVLKKKHIADWSAKVKPSFGASGCSRQQ